MTSPKKACATVLLCGATWLLPQRLWLGGGHRAPNRPATAEAGSTPFAAPPVDEATLIAVALHIGS